MKAIMGPMETIIAGIRPFMCTPRMTKHSPYYER
jgi:hypothetical protein